MWHAPALPWCRQLPGVFGPDRAVKWRLSMDPWGERQPGDVEVTVADVNGVVIVTVTGALDMLSAPRLRAILHAVLTEGPAAVLLDFTTLAFLACAGLEVLAMAHRLAAPHTRLAVAADGPAISRPITLTGVDQIVPLYPTVTHALTALISETT